MMILIAVNLEVIVQVFHLFIVHQDQNLVKQKEKMIASQTMLDLVMKMVIAAMLQVELNAPILFADPQKK